MSSSRTKRKNSVKLGKSGYKWIKPEENSVKLGKIRFKRVQVVKNERKIRSKFNSKLENKTTLKKQN